MEEAKPIRKKRNSYICLGICLVLTLLGIVLLLANGLDSSRFLKGVTLPLACLPLSVVVPVHVFFDFFDHSSDEEKADNYFPIAGKEHAKAARYAFIVALITTLVTVVLFFIYNDNKDVTPMKACVIFLIPNLPTLFVYLAPTLREELKGEKKNLPVLTTVACLALVAAALVIVGMINGEKTYAYSYIVFPIIVLILLLYKRED